MLTEATSSWGHVWVRGLALEMHTSELTQGVRVGDLAPKAHGCDHTRGRRAHGHGCARIRAKMVVLH